MAYAVKYRVEFKDINNVDVKYDILEEGFSGSITSVTPSSNPLTIEWPSDRGNVFNPVRGAVSNLSFYATTDSQFYEFFDANNLQYKVIVYFDSSVYWSGFLMLSDYSEVMLPAPYIVNIKAYDLGFLQSSNWDVTKHGEDNILNTIQTILAETNLSLDLKERVGIKEDGISTSDDVSMLDTINIHQASFIDDQWTSVTLYEALTRLLLTFNAFIMQENDYWNICRVGDMRVNHRYRTFNAAGSLTVYGPEDSRSDLSNYKQLNVNSILLGCANYRKLNMSQDEGVRNLVNNGMVNYIGTASDYWTRTSGSGDYYYDTWVYYRAINYLRINAISTVLNPIIVHENTYNIFAGTVFNFYLKWEVHCGTGTANKVRIEISITGASTYYLNLSDGSWVTTSSVADISYAATSHKYGTADFETNITPIDGLLTIKLYSATGTGASEAYYKLSLTPSNVSTYSILGTRNFTETIDADSLEDSPQINFHYGDARDEEGKDALLGSLKVASTGDETDLWKTKSGSTEKPLIQLTRDCYNAQYSTVAKRIQAELKGDLDYLTVLTHNNAEYLASSIMRNFRKNTLDGEWIEIKTDWGVDITGTFVNGVSGGLFPYDTFITAGNEVTIIKTQTTDEAYVTLEATSVTVDVRYQLTATIADHSSPSDMVTISFGGTDKTDLVVGENTWEVVADATESIHYGIIGSAVADTCYFIISLAIQEIIGA